MHDMTRMHAMAPSSAPSGIMEPSPHHGRGIRHLWTVGEVIRIPSEPREERDDA